MESYYAKSFSYEDGLLNENLIRTRSAHILSQIRRIAPQASTLCDVGSGYGYLLDEAKKRGFSPFGIEPSQNLINHTHVQYAVPTYKGTLEEYLKNGRKTQFDVVCCVHVIEHVFKPDEFISQLLKLVKPGGVLYLETPNADSHLLYGEKERYTFLIPPEHLCILSRFAIALLLPSNAQIIKTATYSYSEHLMGIVKSALHKNSQTNIKTNKKTNANKNTNNNSSKNINKKLSYFLFDCLLAPLFTGILNLYHKGSVLELYIKKKIGKSGL